MDGIRSGIAIALGLEPLPPDLHLLSVAEALLNLEPVPEEAECASCGRRLQTEDMFQSGQQFFCPSCD